jgi:predicted DNA-binding protein with PD1-like motif
VKAFHFSGARVLLGRLERGDDLAEGLVRFCAAHGVEAGSLSGIGALEQAALGYYDQAAGRYDTLQIEQGLEIAALTGNVSRKDGEPFVHAHLVLAGADRRCFGGHMQPGCRVFACEFTLWAFEGPAPERMPDPATGLALW